jgi:hypothetical protein
MVCEDKALVVGSAEDANACSWRCCSVRMRSYLIMTARGLNIL